MEAIFKIPAAAKESRHQVDDYECIILGGPVWAQNISLPIRAFIKRDSEKFERLALFCTEYGEGGEKMLGKAAKPSGNEPIATMVLTEPDIQSDLLDQKVDAFVKTVAAPMEKNL